MRPNAAVRPEYIAAFSELAARIASSLEDLPKRTLPISMYVAGGAALYFYTGERTSRDVDAVFSHRIALPENLEVAYRDADGAARLLYFDRQYNDTFALLHEDAREDSVPLLLKEVNFKILNLRLLSPLDLAVSKISRLSSQDVADIKSLARHGLVRAAPLRRRADSALKGYVGNVERLRTSIDLACRIVEDAERQP